MTHYHACDEADCQLGQRLDVSSWAYIDYRWRSTVTGEPQTALNPRLNPQGWVRERREVIKLQGEWIEIDD